MQPQHSNSENTLEILANRFELLSNEDQLHLFGKQDFIQLIQLHREEDNWADALALCETALQIHLLDTELLSQRADLLIEQKRPEEALEVLALLEQVNADETLTACIRIRALFQLGEVELARVMISELKLNAPESRMVEILHLEATMLSKCDLKEEAYQTLKLILQRDGKNRPALEKIWLASESTRNQKDSLAFHLQLINKDPYNGLAWFNAGQAYYYLLKYEEALEAFEYAGMIESQFSLTFCYAAEVALAIGQPKRALKNLYDILQRTSPEAGILKLMGQSYQALQNTVKARQYYLLARNIDPMDDEVYFQLGKIYMLECKPAIAARYYERAVNLDDRNEDYMIELAEAWVAEGRNAEAEACYVRATETAPEIPEPWIRFAEYQFRQEAYDSILSLTDEALENTWGAGLYFIRAAALFKLGKRKEALRNMEEALEEGYEEHAVFFKYLPDYRTDKDIKAILRYFASENG
jgi:tetratricopeptide (TPR) repeat protein